jgi:hypothetical protein
MLTNKVRFYFAGQFPNNANFSGTLCYQWYFTGRAGVLHVPNICYLCRGRAITTNAVRMLKHFISFRRRVTPIIPYLALTVI